MAQNMKGIFPLPFNVTHFFVDNQKNEALEEEKLGLKDSLATYNITSLLRLLQELPLRERSILELLIDYSQS